MNGVSYLQILQTAFPETVLVITALVVLAADLLALRGQQLGVRLGLLAAIASLGCVAAGVILLNTHGIAEVGGGMLVSTALIRLVKVAILALAIPTLVVSAHARFTNHAGEYVAVVLFAVIGMLFMVSSQDLLMIFASLEMTSLSLYILTAFNKRNAKAAEAALKYFLFGGMSAALALFGFSLLYGLTGTTNLVKLSETIGAHAGDPLLLVALVGVVAGLGFKIAAVPFHLWAPDAYEGAPTPSAALIATGSKVASFFVLAQLMSYAFKGAEGNADWGQLSTGWAMAVGLLAAASMVFGNLAALVQSSVKRLLAYSAIAHAGYMLLGILANSEQGLSALVYYVIIYGLATLGAFAVVSVVEEQTGGDRMNHMAGLSRRSPVLAFCLMLFLLSLAGIPPLAGFFGKFYLFIAAASGGQHEMGLLWLVILGVATSVVSLYYYLMVLKQVFVVEAAEPATATKGSWVVTVVAVLLAAGVLLLGLFPSSLLGLIQSGFESVQ